MSSFTLAGEDLNVNAFSGFDRPDDVQLVAVLSTGTSTHDTVIQQGSVPSPIATLSGRTSDYLQIDLLKQYRNSHAEVTFVEPDEGAHAVVITSLSVQKVAPTLFLWEWTATMIETVAAGS
jgi:hypothetical protein